MTPVEPVDSLVEWLLAVLTALLLIAGIAYAWHLLNIGGQGLATVEKWPDPRCEAAP